MVEIKCCRVKVYNTNADTFRTMSLDFVDSCTHATGKILEENHENFKIRQT